MSLRTLRRRWTWMLLAALASCGYGYGYVEIGYVPCDPYYYDPYCYDYEYYAWVPAALTATDVDGDGRLDAVVADATDGAVWLARGKDGGGFGDTPSTPFTFPTTRAGVAALNADGDAHPDLLVLDGRPGRIATWAGDGQGGFVTYGVTTLAAPDAPGVVRFARGRLDGDAIDDVVTLDEAGAVHVALGTGTGGFVEVAGGDPAAGFLGADAVARLGGVFVTLAELDGRPGTDLGILDGDRARLAVLGGRGDGTFDAARVVETPPLGAVLDVAAVTLDRDRPADLAVLAGSRVDTSAPSTLVVVRPGDGSVRLGPQAVGSARALAPVDLDGDGLTDLWLADPAQRAIRTLHARRPDTD